MGRLGEKRERREETRNDEGRRQKRKDGGGAKGERLDTRTGQRTHLQYVVPRCYKAWRQSGFVARLGLENERGEGRRRLRRGQRLEDVLEHHLGQNKFVGGVHLTRDATLQLHRTAVSLPTFPSVVRAALFPLFPLFLLPCPPPSVSGAGSGRPIVPIVFPPLGTVLAHVAECLEHRQPLLEVGEEGEVLVGEHVSDVCQLLVQAVPAASRCGREK